MKLASEGTAGRTVPIAKDLDLVLIRLDRLSMAAGFAAQRRLAFGRALQVYVELVCECNFFRQRRQRCLRPEVPARRVTLTATQLFLECDSRDRLDEIKHSLAATFGFSLHFRGEATQPPTRQVTQKELSTDEPLILLVTEEEDRTLVSAFLETVYLEWADRATPTLGGETPRHVMTTPAGRIPVATLIDEMERTDLGLLRTGVAAFDYNKLRAHVGLC